MDITDFQTVNEDRLCKWHKDATRDWSILEWAGAMCGEAGEAANIAKKLLRLDLNLPNKEMGLTKTNEQELKYKLACEIADTIIYGLLILSQIGYDSSTTLREVFDKKSMEYGFPERAPR